MSEVPTVRPVVVCPTYNNDGTLIDVLRGVQAEGHDLIIVDDGSTDQTADLLKEFAAASESDHAVRIVSHSLNRGKAAAMSTGFAAAAEFGFTHAITIDTDGQHDPRSLGQLVSQMHEFPDALIIGTRSRSIKGYPDRSQVGRRFSNLAIWAECARSIPDSQSGYRVYPLGLIEAVPCRSSGFAFESEIITRTVWGGGEVRSVPIEACYFPPETRVSHYRPWIDSFRCAGLHMRLVARALWPWPHKRRWPKTPPAKQVPEGPWHKRFINWISPRRVLNDLQKDGVGRVSAAAGFSIGTLIANLPLYPIQTVVAVYVAKRLNMHPVPLLVGSALSTPPVGPALIVAAIVLGHLIVHGTHPDLSGFDLTDWRFFANIFFEWWVGAVIIGLGCMFGSFIVLMFVLKWFLPIRPEAASDVDPSSGGSERLE
jgi:uncharacterized protein (DUF2062 family)